MSSKKKRIRKLTKIIEGLRERLTEVNKAHSAERDDHAKEMAKYREEHTCIWGPAAEFRARGSRETIEEIQRMYIGQMVLNQRRSAVSPAPETKPKRPPRTKKMIEIMTETPVKEQPSNAVIHPSHANVTNKQSKNFGGHGWEPGDKVCLDCGYSDKPEPTAPLGRLIYPCPKRK